MANEYETKTDKQLIHIVVTLPNSADGKAARETLEYRKYLATKRHNSWLLVLTIILASSAVLQVVLKIIMSKSFCLLIWIINTIIQLLKLE